jgi:hypothetical protein
MTFDDEHVKVIRTSAHLRSNNKGHCQRPDHTSMSAIDEGGMFHGEANRILGTKMRQGAYRSQDTSTPTIGPVQAERPLSLIVLQRQ